jgi:hypothetical protein
MAMVNLSKLPKGSVKVFWVLLMLLPFIFYSCNKDDGEDEENSTRSDVRLVGLWQITKMTTIYQGETEILTQSQLDSLGIVWKYLFANDNSVELTTNISGPVITMPGTWSTSPNQLTLILTGPTGAPATLIYEYLIEGILLKLDWEIPGGSKYFGEFTKQ